METARGQTVWFLGHYSKKSCGDAEISYVVKDRESGETLIVIGDANERLGILYVYICDSTASETVISSLLFCQRTCWVHLQSMTIRRR